MLANAASTSSAGPSRAALATRSGHAAQLRCFSLKSSGRSRHVVTAFGRPRGFPSPPGLPLLRRQRDQDAIHPALQQQQHMPSGAVTCAIKTNKPKLVYSGPPSAAVDQSAADGMSPAKGAWAAREGSLQPPVISRTDTYFADKGLEFVLSSDGIDIAELNDLFERVGFPRRDPEKLAIALRHTHRVLWVRCSRGSRFAKEGALLGFARATGDGALSATIWDVAVHPAWQRIGLGRALMERLTALLVEDGISTITLYAEPGVVSLYERLGFVKDVDGVRGMGFQRKALAGARPAVAAVA